MLIDKMLQFLISIFILDKDWIYEERKEDVQILQTLYSENIEVITCEIRTTKRVGSCGYFGTGKTSI